MARWKIYENPVNGYRERVKDGFNWVVLFFGPLWYFFNGLPGKGFGWFLVAVLVGAFTFGFGAIVVWLIAGVKANTEKEKMYLEKGWKFAGYEDELQQVDETLS